MKKNKKHVCWRKIILVSFACFVAITISVVSFILIVTSDARLDLKKLSGSKTEMLTITYNDGTIMSETVQTETSEINDYTKNAFIAIEDKRFKSHNGIDLKRIGGALIANIKNRGKSQGASTITQQLIKNTHLSSKKTYKRKLKEIKLALETERAISKDEIIEAYLNKIYFGNGCVGIEAASKYYFGKIASQIDIAESALLAALVNAPSATEPKKHPEKANKRKNLVLKQMLNQKYISNEEYNSAIAENINFVFERKNKNDTYINAAKEEACKILKISLDDLESSPYIIETFASKNAVEATEKAIKENKVNNSACCGIIIDSKTGGIKSMASTGDFDFVNNKRQPGSVIKPILVYGPAIEEGKITPESFVLDEKTDFGGYSPQNAGNRYSGWISAREALAGSKNVPAIKILNMCGIENAKKYAEAAGISFSETDNSLALALGGMTHGTTIIELAGAYTTFPSGYKKTPSFIKSIRNKNGNYIYIHKTNRNKVFNEDTAYLVYDMMKDTTKFGTAKELSDLPFEIASKTGTVGNTSGNSDCYNVSVTSEDICVVMLTSTNGKSLAQETTGATIPTKIVKQTLKDYYSQNAPQKAIIPDSIEYISLDSNALENQQLIRVKEEKGNVKKLFSKRHSPTEFHEEKSSQTNINFEPQRSNQTYYSIVGRSPKIIINKTDPSSKDINEILQEILGL